MDPSFMPNLPDFNVWPYPGWQDQALTVINIVSLASLGMEAIDPKTRIPVGTAWIALLSWAAYGIVVLTVGWIGSAITSLIATLGWAYILKYRAVRVKGEIPVVSDLERVVDLVRR